LLLETTTIFRSLKSLIHGRKFTDEMRSLRWRSALKRQQSIFTGKEGMLLFVEGEKQFRGKGIMRKSNQI